MKTTRIRSINRLTMFLVDDGVQKPYFSVRSPALPGLRGGSHTLEEFRDRPGDEVGAAVRAKQFMSENFDYLSPKARMAAFRRNKMTVGQFRASVDTNGGMGETGANHRSPFGPGA